MNKMRRLNGLFTVVMTICTLGVVQLNSFSSQAQLDCVGMGSLSGWVTQGLVQHGSAGVDFYGAFPVAGPGSGNSIKVGNSTTYAQPFSSATKTFTVSAAAPYLQYYYAMVNLDFPHGPADAASSAVSILGPTGAVIPCTFYQVFAAAGGPPGFQQSTRPNECNLINQCSYPISYLPWRTSVVDLTAYIGQNVTIRLTNAWCGPGVDWGYAYFDAECVDFSIQRMCVGSATTLIAPPGGSAYLWNTGATTQSINITTPGVYTCQITPIQGSSCNINLSINATMYPTPTADFSMNTNSICAGGQVQFTDNSTVTGGGSVNTYQWNFGDGISTPASSGAITGVVQTTGTYTGPNHTYNSSSNSNVTLSIVTADGCVSTQTKTVTVTNAPTATIGTTAVVCQNDAAPVVTFSGQGTAGPFTFTYNLNGGANQSVTSPVGNSNATITVPTTTGGTYNYTLVSVSDPSSPTCNQAQVGSAQITVNPLPTATIAGTATVCQNGTSPVVTFTGVNGSSNYTFTYTLNGGANQTITTSGSASATINAPTGTSGTFNYTLVSVSDVATGCGQAQTGSAVITVNPMPTATIAGTVVVCQTDAAPSITFTGANGSSDYVFTYNLNGGANQTITTSGTNTAVITASTATSGTFTYNLLNVQDVTTGCGQAQTGSAIVTVNPLPTATIVGTTSICQNGASPVITFTGANGSSDYTFTYNLNGGANQTLTTSGSASATITVPTAVSGTFTYNLLSVSNVTTGCGQAQVSSATVIVSPLPTAAITGTVSVCRNDTEPQIVFTGALGTSNYTFTYNINGGANQAVTTSGTNTVSVNAPTNTAGTFTYNLLNVQDVTSLCGQSQAGVVTITVNPLPVASSSAPIEVCLNDSQPSITFEGATGTSPYTFTYALNGGAAQQISTLSGSNTVSITVPTTTAGTFNYLITNIKEGSVLGCQQNQNISTSVIVHALPVIFAGNDISLCVGQTVILTGSGAGSGGSYAWNQGITNGVGFVPSDTTIYTVIGTDIHGCKGTDQVTVNVVPFPTMDILGHNLYGCQPVASSFDNLSTGNLVNCQWIFSNGVTINDCGSVNVTFENPGCYNVTLIASTPEGCSNTLTLNNYICVEANPVANFHTTPDVLYTYNWDADMVNESYGASNYIWDFGDGSAISTATNPTHEYPNVYGDSYQIMLIAITDAGCRDTAYQVIELKEELLFYVPNAFTPDGDEFNQGFKPIFATGYDPQGYTLLIFNRWGDIVFESHDVNVGWDGLYNGIQCQDGTYTWKIRIKTRTTDKVNEYTGHVTILR